MLRIIGFVLLITLALSAQPAVAQTTVSGHFVTIWPDAPSGEQPPRYYLIDKSGRWVELAIGEAVKGLRSFDRKQVTVEGSYEEPLAAANADQVPQEAKQKFRVRSILPDKESFAPIAAEAAQAAVIGSKPWATILCRFADSTGITPHERSWFEGLMTGSEYPSMNHFWRELSYGQINLVGSQVVGWLNLPRPRSYYVSDTNGDGIEDADLQRLTDDCAAVADSQVYFPAFAGINLVFNENLGCCAFGGAVWLSLDGSEKIYGATWATASAGQSLWAHEMGHGFGLPHSSGPYNKTYDSAWDVMSAQWWGCPTSGPDPIFHCIGQHTISFHKEMLGWIPSGRLYTAASGSSNTIEIERLAQPSESGYLMAKIPINGSATEFYTVETRHRVGYDGPLPGNAVIIHRVDTANRSDRQAQVVDIDNNGDPNDAAAMWMPGETFVGVSGIKVSVVNATATGFLVTIENGGLVPPLQISTGGHISQKLHYIPASNAFYGIGSDNAIWKWDNTAKQWSRATGCCVKEDFHFLDEANIYAIGLDNQVWHWNGIQWSRASEGGMLHQKIWYSNGHVYGIGLDNQIWRMIWFFGSTAEWTQITRGSVKIKDDFHFVSESEIYAIGLDSQIWRWNGNVWSQHSSGGHIGQSLDFGSESVLYGIGTDNRIWRWSNGSWSALHDGGQIKDDFAVIGNAASYGIGLDGQIWQLSSD